jgi:hypothetical protein
MSNIGDSIKYLYEKFILRDLLSIVAPGFIVSLSILLFPFSLTQILSFLKEIPFLIYIPIYGVIFIVGFAIQCFGARCRIIRFHNRVTDKNYYKKLVGFLKATKDNNIMRDNWERFVVLKQMCGNGSLAIFISALLILTNSRIQPKIPLVIEIVPPLALSAFLLWSHYVHLNRQMDWEDANI